MTVIEFTKNTPQELLRMGTKAYNAGKELDDCPFTGKDRKLWRRGFCNNKYRALESMRNCDQDGYLRITPQ